MDEYKAIMKAINDKLAEDEMRIEYLRKENQRLEQENQSLKEKIDDMNF